jgi:hypothetical protein
MPGASGQIRRKATTSVLSALTAALLTPVAAFGSSGEITRALANADWTVGDIAATVSWNGCAGGAGLSDCAWIPYATIGPGASESECASPKRDWPGLGEGVRLAFRSGELNGPDTSRHESSMVSLRGVPEQLLCLFAIESAWTSGAFRSLALDAALLTVPPATSGVEASAPEEEPPAEEPPEPPPAEGEPPEPPAEEEPPSLAEGPARPLGAEEPPGLVDEPAKPPDGEIARALANADWTRGSIAGSVAWDGCARMIGTAASYCAWIPYTTIGPGGSESECASAERDWSSLGENVSLVSWGGEAIGAGRYEFDFPGIWLDGSSDRLLCLAVIEVTQTGTYSHRLAAALLTAPPMVSDAKAVAEN